MTVTSEFLVAVVLERRLVESGRWQVAQWDLLGVMLADAVGTPNQPRTIREEGEFRQVLWPAMRLHLYPDAAESYWFNLVGKKPMLYVVCRPGEDDMPEPFLVTVDHDEASAHGEADEIIYSIEIPGAIHDALEHFVVTHYQPKMKYKRQRQQWSEAKPNAKTPSILH